MANGEGGGQSNASPGAQGGAAGQQGQQDTSQQNASAGGQAAGGGQGQQNGGDAGQQQQSQQQQQQPNTSKLYTESEHQTHINSVLAQRLPAEREAGKREAQAQVETLTGKVTSLETQLNESNGAISVMQAAAGLRAKNPWVVYAAIKSELKYGADGKPTNTTDLLTKFRKENGGLFYKGGIDAGDSGAGGAGHSTINDFIRGA